MPKRGTITYLKKSVKLACFVFQLVIPEMSDNLSGRIFLPTEKLWITVGKRRSQPKVEDQSSQQYTARMTTGLNRASDGNPFIKNWNSGPPQGLFRFTQVPFWKETREMIGETALLPDLLDLVLEYACPKEDSMW